MNLLLGVILAFIALTTGSPLVALLLGISFTLLIGSNEELILKSTGTKLLQIGIVILGLTISSSGAINLTTKYFPYISVFVIVIFLVGLISFIAGFTLTSIVSELVIITLLITHKPEL